LLNIEEKGKNLTFSINKRNAIIIYGVQDFRVEKSAILSSSIFKMPDQELFHLLFSGNSQTLSFGMNHPFLAAIITGIIPIKPPKIEGNSGPKNSAESIYGVDTQAPANIANRSEEHTSELQSRF